MTFWTGVAAFIATPGQWIPVVVSLVALGVAIFTATQTWRYYPRPRISVARAGGDYMPTYMTEGDDNKKIPGSDHVNTTMQVSITNFGNGAAHDVRFGSGTYWANWTPLGNLTPNAVVTGKGIASFPASGPWQNYAVTWLQYPGPRRWMLNVDKGEAYRLPKETKARRLRLGALASLQKGWLRLRGNRG